MTVAMPHELNQFVYIACGMFLVKLILERGALFYFPDPFGFLLQCLSIESYQSEEFSTTFTCFT